VTYDREPGVCDVCPESEATPMPFEAVETVELMGETVEVCKSCKADLKASQMLCGTRKGDDEDTN
jgi:hypothetical protein